MIVEAKGGDGASLLTYPLLKAEEPKLRVIGDVHGAMGYYHLLADGAPYTLAVGDMGRNLDKIDLDPQKHRIIAGNHEIYDPAWPSYYKNYPHFLDDWGTLDVPGLPTIFYVRGAWSIDWRRRIHNIPPDWWAEEELSIPQLEDAIRAYIELKPRIVVTHEAPLDIVSMVTDPEVARWFGYEQGIMKTKTNQAFQAMLENHRPERWIFGHYHKRRDFEFDGTKFTCLDMIRSGERNLPNSFIDL